MNRYDLKRMLIDMGVPPDLYNLDGIGRTDERFCLEFTNEKWRVCFRERGICTTDEAFESEEAACCFIYEQLV